MTERRFVSIQTKRKNVFISYSHVDAGWLERLKIHMKPLEREGAINLWSDSMIQPGSRWREEIRKAIEKAKVAVLLISADFLASDFIDKNELPPLLAAAEKEDAIILPVIVSPCYFEQTKSLSKYQSVNPPTKSLISMSKAEQEEVFVKIVRVIVSTLREAETDQLVKDKRPAIKTPKFRSTPKEKLSVDDVKSMLKDNGFFDSEYNKSGHGFSNSYELQNDGKVVCDHASGLMWQQSGSDKRMSYKNAKAYVTKLNSDQFAGHNDWRLPTLEEVMSLMEPVKKNGGLYIDPVFDREQTWIWTSDIYSASRVWVIYFNSGYCHRDDINEFFTYVRAVR